MSFAIEETFIFITMLANIKNPYLFHPIFIIFEGFFFNFMLKKWNIDGIFSVNLSVTGNSAGWKITKLPSCLLETFRPIVLSQISVSLSVSCFSLPQC